MEGFQLEIKGGNNLKFKICSPLSRANLLFFIGSLYYGQCKGGFALVVVQVHKLLYKLKWWFASAANVSSELIVISAFYNLSTYVQVL